MLLGIIIFRDRWIFGIIFWRTRFHEPSSNVWREVYGALDGKQEWVRKTRSIEIERSFGYLDYLPINPPLRTGNWMEGRSPRNSFTSPFHSNSEGSLEDSATMFTSSRTSGSSSTSDSAICFMKVTQIRKFRFWFRFRFSKLWHCSKPFGKHTCRITSRHSIKLIAKCGCAEFWGVRTNSFLLLVLVPYCSSNDRLLWSRSARHQHLVVALPFVQT